MEDFNENNEVISGEETVVPETEETPVNESPEIQQDVAFDETAENSDTPESAGLNDTKPDYSYGGVTPDYAAAHFNKINYTDQKPISDYSHFGKGLKIFCAALAVVILLVGVCAGGYFLGRGSNKANFYRNDVKLNLSAKPKSGEGMTAAEVYNELNESIVGIRVYNSNGAFDASGVIYTEDGYVITNDHIYSSVAAPKFKIYTFDGKEYAAEYVAGDTVSDLAVLKIKDSSGFKVPEFGDSNELVCGENVFAVGRPNDASDETSITAGIISLTSRRVKSKTNYASRLIQTDSAINPGSSGGALVNMYGQVIGITSSKLSGENYDRIGFAIPTVTVKRVVDQLISSGKVTDRAKLGITYTEINSIVKELENRATTGLLVASVSSDSDLYGKVSKDDIITHINGIEITNDDMVLDIIESSKAGDTIKVTVLSPSGEETEISAKLGANIGESSFSLDESKADNSSGSDKLPDEQPGGGTFDFPFGD